MTPKISIIVPVYNAEKYLRQCIDSVMSQTLIEFELLLINDGSKDNSGMICDEYARKDKRIRVFHKKNSGVSASRNLGLDYAIGQYIIFLDSDDYWYDNEILEVLYYKAETFNLDIIRGEYKAVNQSGELLFERSLSKKKQKHIDNILSSFVFYTDIICGENFLVLSLIKRDAIGGLRFTVNRSFLEDMEFYAKLLINKLKCMYIPRRFYAYRKIAESASHTHKIKNLQDSFSMCDIFYNCSENTDDINLKKVYRYNSIMMYYWTLETLTFDVYYKNRSKIIEDLKLKETQNKVSKWARYKTDNIYPLFIYLNPSLGVKLLKIYIKFKCLVHKVIN